jgi:hypothetical protein
LSALPAVTKTRAPKALASWMALVPTPDAPPWMRIDSPAASRPRSMIDGQIVKNVSGMAAASSMVKPRGTGRALVSSTLAYSA